MKSEKAIIVRGQYEYEGCKMKLLWTREDRKDYYKTLAEMGLPPVDPFTSIRADKGETKIEEELAERDYIIEGFGLNFVMGHAGLVSVVFLRDDIQLCPSIGEGIVGDGQTFQIQECIKLTKGEKIKVKVKNNDELDHMVGVRVDINELPEKF